MIYPRIIASLAALVSAAGGAAAPSSRVPVAIAIPVGHDAVSQEFDHELQALLRADPRLRLATATDHRTIVIGADQITTDKVKERSITIIVGYVRARDGERNIPIIRACPENGINECARDFILVARKLAAF